MKKMMSATAVTVCVLSAFPSASNADGVSAVYTTDGRFIDDIEIVGDVTMPSGETYAVLEMMSEHMRFYVDPEAIYVTLDNNNPILTEQTRFQGFWLDQRTSDNTIWPACQTEAFDEFGTAYQAHGDLIWANTGIADNGYDLWFYIELGTCDSKPEAWGVSAAATEGVDQNEDPNTQLSESPSFTLTDANNTIFTVRVSPDGTTLEANKGTENLAIYANCTAFAPLHGWGTWAWANGGFIIAFDTADFSFPRRDAPIDNGGGCQL